MAAELWERIYQFNVEATGIRDGRWLRAVIREEDGELVAGRAGWTWGGCGHVDSLWVRADRRGRGLGSRLYADGASTHSFQAPEMYLRRGYVERGRIEDYPHGYAHLHLVKRLLG